MKQIAVISGKGGTGKTMLLSSIVALAKNKVIVDCDVDASNLHIMLDPKILRTEEYFGGKKAKKDPALCDLCGICEQLCRFGAIDKNMNISDLNCEGCSLCAIACPQNAITMKDNLSGQWFVSSTKYGTFVHAKLGPAEENSGKLVAQIKKHAKLIADNEQSDYILVDGPPGIGCPLMSTLSGVDTALIVTEPTLSGMHDMERAADITKKFNIDTKVVINKYDINIGNSAKIERICSQRGLDLIGKIHFSKSIVDAIVKRIPPVEYCNGEIQSSIVNIWERIK